MFDVHFLVNPWYETILPKFFFLSDWPLFRQAATLVFNIGVKTPFKGGTRAKPIGIGYLVEPAVTRVFILAHPVMLKIFITGAVSQKTAKPSVWTIDHIPMGRFNKLTRGLIHLLRISRCSGITCKGSLVWMGCAGHQNDHHHYCQPHKWSDKKANFF